MTATFGLIGRITARWKELFYTREVELTYDVAAGEYGLRESYRSRFPSDKFGWRHYAKTLPVRTLVIKQADFAKIVEQAPRFLTIHQRMGKGLVK